MIPFAAAFMIFHFYPLANTVYYAFCYIKGQGRTDPPQFLPSIGEPWYKNFMEIFQSTSFHDAFRNTMIMWVLGFIPQILVSLLLAAWFSNPSLRLKGQRFFKTVIYLPNLIMASAFAMLFFTMFSNVGPVNSVLQGMGIISEPYAFLDHVGSTRGLVALMNFLMWFGNTTILLLSGMLGISTDLFEAAEIDGANGTQIFFRITMPLLKPIFIYVLITSLIGGLQMFDVPQILTGGGENPQRSAMTLIMYLNKHLFSKNFGMGGALSVILLIITAILSFFVFKMTASDEVKKKRK